MKNILFVDDEPLVLNSLKRTMRKERHRWEAHYASGGGEAIELLEKRTFDLLVTDMKMPIVDGMKVLSTAEELRPEMPRLALSGYSENESDAKFTNLAHQFLNKPCESDVLKNTISTLIGES